MIFPESLKSLKIGKFVFAESSIETFDLSNCANLESLDIEDSAFSSCRELKRVLLPKSLTSLKIGEEAFHGDIKMQTIDLSKLLNLKKVEISETTYNQLEVKFHHVSLGRKLKLFCFDILHSLKQFLNFLLISLRRFF